MVTAFGVVLVAAIVWMSGPGARWVLENLDGVPVGGATGLSGRDLAAALDAVRGRVLAVATGLAALPALFYAGRIARRMFRLREQGHVTGRYDKAVEQFGNPEAPVRIAGLYALEQLAQDTPALRQTIVDVICAYLRMPYTPPTEQSRNRKRRAGRDAYEERQVRLTAQRILATHLRHDPEPRHPGRSSRAAPGRRYWPGLRFDLSGATLVDFDVRDCHIGYTDFIGATFNGDTRFSGATFAGIADFAGATFTGNADFYNAVFTGEARFSGVTFNGDVWFAWSTFASDADFRNATFTGIAAFSDVTFSTGAGFSEATFAGGARFSRAVFNGDALFHMASFAVTATFFQSTFAGNALFSHAAFTGNVRFNKATGLEYAKLAQVRVLSGPKHKVHWPMAWREVPDGRGGRTVRLATGVSADSTTTEDEAAAQDQGV
ncbi:Pentapeptide repeat-containing protein [Nonomuraea jiangxiensis]|uniref:Pentapeptide repeat-containing protein n=2 Tax=Nonomuraea jiangxiensis TaxID=633440 RepID=A0A1G9IQX2_9ACTN|nr:Pentapeptide repeat-containing protein [Nonomuraea jiangxiensis]